MSVDGESLVEPTAESPTRIEAVKVDSFYAFCYCRSS